MLAPRSVALPCMAVSSSWSRTRAVVVELGRICPTSDPAPRARAPFRLMSLLSQLSGPFVNVVAVLLGTLLGLTVGGRVPPQTHRSLLQTLSLVTLFIGLDMAGSLNRVSAGSVPGVILALVSLAAGVVIGEALGIEERLGRLGKTLRRRFRGEGRFTEGFVAASLLFCVGPLTFVVGCKTA